MGLVTTFACFTRASERERKVKKIYFGQLINKREEHKSWNEQIEKDLGFSRRQSKICTDQHAWAHQPSVVPLPGANRCFFVPEPAELLFELVRFRELLAVA